MPKIKQLAVGGNITEEIANAINSMRQVKLNLLDREELNTLSGEIDKVKKRIENALKVLDKYEVEELRQKANSLGYDIKPMEIPMEIPEQ